MTGDEIAAANASGASLRSRIAAAGRYPALQRARVASGPGIHASEKGTIATAVAAGLGTTASGSTACEQFPDLVFWRTRRDGAESAGACGSNAEAPVCGPRVRSLLRCDPAARPALGCTAALTLAMAWAIPTARDPRIHETGPGFGLQAWGFSGSRLPEPGSRIPARFTFLHRDPAPARLPPWPCRLVVKPTLLEVIEEGWERSPTLRRQCLELADASSVVVLEWLESRNSQSRATTRMGTGSGGVVVAMVSVPPRSNAIELVAHELEHVLERTRGQDFAAESRRPDSGVWQAYGGFESQRAIDIGRQVAREVADSRRVRSAPRTKRFRGPPTAEPG